MMLSTSLPRACPAAGVAATGRSLKARQTKAPRPQVARATFFEDQVDEEPMLAAKDEGLAASEAVVDVPAEPAAEPLPPGVPASGDEAEQGVFDYYKEKLGLEIPSEEEEEETPTQVVAAGIFNVYATVYQLWAQLVPDKRAKILITGAGDDCSVGAMILDDMSDLHGVDFDEERIAECRKLVEMGSIPGETLDRCLKLTATNTRELSAAVGDRVPFDAILDVERTYPNEDKTEEERAEYLSVVSKELHEVLKPGGILISMTRPPVLPAELLSEDAFGDAALWTAHQAPVEGAEDVNIWVMQRSSEE